VYSSTRRIVTSQDKVVGTASMMPAENGKGRFLKDCGLKNDAMADRITLILKMSVG
jgi:hypothetical protein